MLARTPVPDQHCTRSLLVLEIVVALFYVYYMVVEGVKVHRYGIGFLFRVSFAARMWMRHATRSCLGLCGRWQ